MFKRTIVHRYIYPVLRCMPKGLWNEFSCLCASFTARTIGSPIRFSHKQFRLEEYPANGLPPSLLQPFIDFCYPADLPDRQQQIDLDRNLYWDHTSTLLVLNQNETIVGCIQMVFGEGSQRLPVEYSRVAATDGSAKPCNLREYAPSGSISEIYRCRRSFDLSRMDAIQVLMMLFKAVLAKTIQCGTAYSCISFDPDKTDLRHMYINKLTFVDPAVSLTFGTNPKQWSLLIKDWSYHETHYATESTTHFYIQTWSRMGLKQKHLTLPGQTSATLKTGPGNVLFAETCTARQGLRRKKRNTNS